MNDFEITKNGEIGEAKGHLVDSTPLEPYKDLLKSVKELNISKLYSVSWIGLHRLVDTVSSLENWVELSGIPAAIYRTLLLFPDFGTKCGIKSFQVQIKTDQNPEKEILTPQTLAKLSAEQGAFVVLESGAKVYGSIDYLCRPFFANGNGPKPFYLHSWAQNNGDHATFWYDYFNFMRVILENCTLAQAATSRLIEECLQQICMRVSNAESAIKVLIPDFAEARARAMMSWMPHVHDISQSSVDSIKKAAQHLEGILFKLEDDLSLGHSDGTLESFFDYLKSLSEFDKILHPIARKLDDIGVELGEKVLQYGDVLALKSSFNKIDSSSINEKNIVNLRRKFKFDTTKNLNWDDTAYEVQQEFKSLQRDLERCIVGMQGFDLVRQVFEHRIKEIKIIQENLEGIKETAITWESVRDKIQDQIKDRMVTDQEKFAFKFHFPKAESQNQDKLKAGDIFLF